MKVIIDIEANGLIDPTEIWCVVCKDVETCHTCVFERLTTDASEAARFREFASSVTCWIGHNLLSYDLRVLNDLHIYTPPDDCDVHDTFVISKLVDYPRQGHSIEAYGEEFGLLKGDIKDFSRYTPEMLEYCKRDVDINHKVYLKYKKYIDDSLKEKFGRGIPLEQNFQYVVNKMEKNGFYLDVPVVEKLLKKVETRLAELDAAFVSAFPPRLKLIREITPKETKYGTISLTSIPKHLRGDLTVFSVGAPFSYCDWVSFNPGSPKQVVQVLNEAGWRPEEKTDGHKDTEREYNKLKRMRTRPRELDIRMSALYTALNKLAVHGWKINENNLATLPTTADPAARTLAERILYESRRKTLVEWLSLTRLNIKVEKKSIDENIAKFGGTKNIGNENTTLSPITASRSKIMIDLLKSKRLNANCVEENNHSLSITIIPAEQSAGYSAADAIAVLDGLRSEGLQSSITSTRVHGRFSGIGAWTHRMSHQKPNMANIPNEFTLDNSVKLLGKELRQCWRAPKGRLLTGVDAEGIQLRIFAHYVDNAELIHALVSGDKKKKTDPHSYNQGVLGDVCKSRAAAKRFLYALFLGAGNDKLASILECSRGECDLALERLLTQYPGFAILKSDVIPSDARRGWFEGIDGRKVRIPGEDIGTRRHLAMSGYLQNGEAVVMKTAAVIADPQLIQFNSFIVDIIHDEAQNETPNNLDIALEVANIWDKAIIEAGEIYGLKCPMAGSYINDHGKYTIGTNWYMTH